MAPTAIQVSTHAADVAIGTDDQTGGDNKIDATPPIQVLIENDSSNDAAKSDAEHDEESASKGKGPGFMFHDRVNNSHGGVVVQQVFHRECYAHVDAAPVVFKAPVNNVNGIIAQTVFKAKTTSENGSKRMGDNCDFHLGQNKKKSGDMAGKPVSADIGVSGRIGSNLPFLPGILMPREKKNVRANLKKALVEKCAESIRFMEAFDRQRSDRSIGEDIKELFATELDLIHKEVQELGKKALEEEYCVRLEKAGLKHMNTKIDCIGRIEEFLKSKEMRRIHEKDQLHWILLSIDCFHSVRVDKGSSETWLCRKVKTYANQRSGFNFDITIRVPSKSKNTTLRHSLITLAQSGFNTIKERLKNTQVTAFGKSITTRNYTNKGTGDKQFFYIEIPLADLTSVKYDQTYYLQVERKDFGTKPTFDMVTCCNWIRHHAFHLSMRAKKLKLTKEVMYRIVNEAYNDPITDDKGPSVDTYGYKYEYPKGSVKCGTHTILGKRASDTSSMKLDNKRPSDLHSHSQGVSINGERLNSLHPQSTPLKVNHSPNGSSPSISPVRIDRGASNGFTNDMSESLGDIQDIFNEVSVLLILVIYFLFS